MQALKGIIWFSFLLVTLGACFDPPEFSNKPEILFKDIQYFQGEDFNDSILLFIDFRDGDGDVGLPTGGNGIDYPYNKVFLFQGNSNEDIVQVPVYIPRLIDGSPVDCLPKFLDLDLSAGPLISDDIRNNNPDLDSLPSPTEFPDKCLYYYSQEAYLVNEEFITLIDPALIIDTVAANAPVPTLTVPNTEISYDCSTDFGILQSDETMYFIYGNFFSVQNPNYFNLEIDFLVKNNAGSFDEYDWLTAFPPDCGITYDGRLPILSDSNSPVEGTIRYNIKGFGFLQLFSIKTLKLRITIKDRALNKSNILETPEFTLSDIKAN
ncbi:MAG: hypothetical protein L0Y35_03705 [Flammeovirgaceae bacterium]|nr:hypothetical protein [Flammeovirgaceae bacterium]